jgi:hypothetical protein
VQKFDIASEKRAKSPRSATSVLVNYFNYKKGTFYRTHTNILAKIFDKYGYEKKPKLVWYLPPLRVKMKIFKYHLKGLLILMRLIIFFISVSEWIKGVCYG